MTAGSDREYTHIGKVIHEYRTKNGITHQKLADLCGVSQSTLQRVKTGETALNIDTAIRIADILGISLDELAGRKKYHQEDPALVARLAELEHDKRNLEESVRVITARMEEKDQLISDQRQTISSQRASIRRNDIFKSILIGALAVLSLGFIAAAIIIALQL